MAELTVRCSSPSCRAHIVVSGGRVTPAVVEAALELHGWVGDPDEPDRHLCPRCAFAL